MLVSDGKYSWLRGDSPGRISINGSFVDVFYSREGRKEWLAIDRDALTVLLAGEQKQGESVMAQIEHDEPADASTAARIAQERLNSFLEKDDARREAQAKEPT